MYSLQKLVEGQEKDRKYKSQRDKKADQDVKRSKADRVLKKNNIVKGDKSKTGKKGGGLLDGIFGGLGGMVLVVEY